MINYLETHLVDHCNLRCKGCSHFSGLAPEQFTSLESFTKQIKRLSEISSLHILRLMGGEPLLHPQVIDFCTTARNYFPRTQIVLVTNGILLPTLSDDQINILNQNQIELCMSDYGLKLDWAQINKFKTYYFHGKQQMYNISLDLDGQQNKEISFKNCDLVNGGWYFLKDGYIYQCCIMANIDFFCNYFNKQLEINKNDISINIFNHTEEEILAFLHKPHETCKYCNTIKRHHSYQNFTISKEDIKEWTI